MKKTAIRSMPPYFNRYINRVEDVDLKEAFIKSMQQLDAIRTVELMAVGTSVYAPGKWTVHDILQHLIDSERIFNYRALRFARNDRGPLQGFNQESFAIRADANKRKLVDILDELKIVRQCSKMLFDSFDDMAMLQTGICNNVEISVLAIGFTIIGHQIHHLNIIHERYLPLAK